MDEILSKLEAIETRLKRLEQRVGIKTPIETSKPLEQKSVPPIRPSGIPQSEKETKETYGGNWLGIVAVICFILAAGFIVKLSIESGWLTHARQIGLAALLGFSLIGIGLTLKGTDKEYMSLLPAGGIVILNLTVFAAHSLYGLIGFAPALGLIGSISGLALWLYTKIRHDIYPLMAAVGAYLAPVLLIDPDKAPLFTLYYFLICSVVFSIISIYLSSRMLTIVSGYLALLITAFIGTGLNNDTAIAWVLAGHFITFSIGTFLYSQQNKKHLTREESHAFLLLLFIFYATEYYYVSRINLTLAPWISLSYAGFLIGLYTAAKKYLTVGTNSQFIIVSFASVVFFHSFYLEILPEELKPWLFIALALGLAFLFRKQNQDRPESSVFLFPALAVIAVMAIEYLKQIWSLLTETTAASFLDTAVPIAMIASLWVIIATNSAVRTTQSNGGNVILAAAHALVIVAFYNFFKDSGSLAVSASWLAYAGAVIAFGFLGRDSVITKSAVMVLGFAAAKALLYDAASAPTLIRIFCLILTGAVLYGAGLLMRKISQWEQTQD